MCVRVYKRIYTRAHGLTEELNEAALAVRLVVLLLEGAFVELLKAESAHKVLRVELLAHGGDAAARDGLLAAGAERAAALVVVRLTVRLAVVVEEAAVYERREALLQNQKRGGSKHAPTGSVCHDICRTRPVAHPADEALGVPQ